MKAGGRYMLACISVQWSTIVYPLYGRQRCLFYVSLLVRGQTEGRYMSITPAGMSSFYRTYNTALLVGRGVRRHPGSLEAIGQKTCKLLPHVPYA